MRDRETAEKRGGKAAVVRLTEEVVGKLKVVTRCALAFLWQDVNDVGRQQPGERTERDLGSSRPEGLVPFVSLN